MGEDATFEVFAKRLSDVGLGGVMLALETLLKLFNGEKFGNLVLQVATE